MATNKSNMGRYIWGALGVIAILAGAWWGFGNGPYLAGEARGGASCSGCGPTGCSASATSWREFGRKILTNGRSRTQGDGQ